MQSYTLCLADPYLTVRLSNDTAEWPALLTHIRQVRGSNVGTETGCPQSRLRGFLSPSMQIPGYY